jgi:DNA-directed RNA polymerase subunit M/transcription elongation factor TFIIS
MSDILDDYTLSYLQNIPESEAIALLSKYYSFKSTELSDIIEEIRQPKKTRKLSAALCPHCKTGSIITREVQSRSTDEGMTTMRICNQCGKVIF